MRSLFDISTDLSALGEILAETGGEFTEDEIGQALERWFDELGTERDQKIDNYCALIREFEERAVARETEVTRLIALAGSDNNNAERLRRRLKLFFEIQGITRLETPRFRVSVQKNGGKAHLSVPEEWERNPASAPEQFHRRKIELDKDAIRTALEDGCEVDGCEIVPRGTHLRLR